MFSSIRPGKVVAARGSKYLHGRTSGNRETITVIAAISADGGTVPPHVIIKGKTIRSLNSFQPDDAPEGTTWSWSQTGWTKQGIPGDHLSGKTGKAGNIREFETCQGNVRHVVNSQGIVREMSGKNLVMEKCPKTVHY